VPNSDRKIVLDTYAWIEYFKGSMEKARKFIDGNFELFTPSIVIAELSDKYRRENIQEWEVRNRFIKLKSRIIYLDEKIADKAGELKQLLRKTHKDAGIADAIILAHAYALDAKILTGDEHLKDLENSIDLTK